MEYSEAKYIQFGFLTEQEWRRFAVCKVSEPYSNNGSTTNTVYDERMGILVSGGTLCITCGKNNMYCPGHFGYIELPEPVYNPKCMRIITMILKSICIRCAKPRIRANELKLKYNDIPASKHANRLKQLVKKSETIHVCPNPECANLPEEERVLYSFEHKQKELVINKYIGDKKQSLQVSARECLSIFLRISDETMKFLGFNTSLSKNPAFTSDDVLIDEDMKHLHQVRPEAFIFTVFPVSPPSTRTWVVKDGVKHNDDLTDV